MIPIDKERLQEAIKQTDAIFALEGFEPTEQIRATDAAVLAGRVTFSQVADEVRDYAMKNKTLDGFIESRPWI
ncbi:antitoxin VbhA family protein [Verminephrobacter aporrectodeae]|uniref:antitoxin VbhA family protein n=1 Tax=Verminephrobacter aporrectodeae TaxID=1110389 RepID=UPI00191C3C75|nr:antitoxin VbhA family protein [Verminephrobacter aporrectodeae]